MVAEIQTTTCGCKGDISECACKSGQCVCSSCPRSVETSSKGKSVISETVCGCKGDESVCACRTGQCICSACPKSSKATKA